MKLEERENLKLQYVNRIQTNTTHINNIQESDTDLIEKITKNLTSTNEIQTLKANHLSKNGVITADNTDTVSPNMDKKQQDNQNKPQKHKEPNKSFYQNMKKDQNLPKKNIYSINS